MYDCYMMLSGPFASCERPWFGLWMHEVLVRVGWGFRNRPGLLTPRDQIAQAAGVMAGRSEPAGQPEGKEPWYGVSQA